MDRIIIADIKPQNDDNSFSIKWFSEGRFITKTNVSYKISINLIGGEYLDFYIFAEEISEPLTNGIVIIS